MTLIQDDDDGELSILQKRLFHAMAANMDSVVIFAQKLRIDRDAFIGMCGEAFDAFDETEEERQ